MSSTRYQTLSRAFVVLAALLLTAADGLAQTGSNTGVITGVVRDASTGEVLPGAGVLVEGTNQGDATGTNGRFSLADVPAGTHVLRVSLLGYQPAERSIEVRDGQTTLLEVELSEQAVELGEIAVVGRRSRFVAETVTTASKIGASPIETPYSLSVITRDQLAIQDVGNLAEAMRYTPGTQGERWGFEPRFTWVSIRGFDVTEAGLYRDGLQLRNPRFVVGYNVEPYGAERIEVLRGPASVLYGAGSPGGIVSFVSKRPTQVGLGEVEVEAGSFGRLQGKLDVGGPIDERGAFSYRLTGLYRDSDTQVDYVENDRVFVAPAFTWRPGRSTSLTLLGHFMNDKTGSSQALPAEGVLDPSPAGEIPVDRFTGEPGVDQYDRTEFTVSSLFEHRIGQTWTLRQNARYYDSHLDDVTVYSTGLAADGRTLERAIFGSFGSLSGLALDQQLVASFAAGPVAYTLLGGVDFQHVNAGSDQTYGAAPSLDIFAPDYGQPVAAPPVYADTETLQRQVGVYLQSQVKLRERWVLSLNGRHDWASTETDDHLQNATTEQTDRAFSGRAGLVYVSPVGLAPYVSYAESFLPALGIDAATGEAFAPERGRQIEAGLKYQPPGVNSFVTVALFDLTRKNFLQYDPATWLQVQTGEVRSRGVELEAVASLWSGLDLIAGASLLDLEVTESSVAAEVGERPAQVPTQSASLWANYAVRHGALRGLGLGAGVRYLGSTYGDVPNTIETPATTLADAAAYYDWKQFRLSLNVQNVLDEQYVAAAFARSSTLVTYGPARQFTASLRYSW